MMAGATDPDHDAAIERVFVRSEPEVRALVRTLIRRALALPGHRGRSQGGPASI